MLRKFVLSLSSAAIIFASAGSSEAGGLFRRSHGHANRCQSVCVVQNNHCPTPICQPQVCQPTPCQPQPCESQSVPLVIGVDIPALLETVPNASPDRIIELTEAAADRAYAELHTDPLEVKVRKRVLRHLVKRNGKLAADLRRAGVEIPRIPRFCPVIDTPGYCDDPNYGCEPGYDFDYCVYDRQYTCWVTALCTACESGNTSSGECSTYCGS